MDIVKRNSSSPFKLQRSMVDQGGSGGAYETGGYNPSTVYNNDAANEAIESLGKVIGAAISSRTAGDENKSDLKTKENLSKRKQELSKKKEDLMGVAGVDNKRERLDRKINRTEKRSSKVEGRIKEYNESINPFVKSALSTNILPAKAVKKEEPKVESKPKEEDWKSKLRFFGK
jgi:hypothetical protein